MEVQLSLKHKMVAVPANPKLENLYPHAKHMEFNGSDHIILSHEPGETWWLRQQGYNVPAPILYHYDFPHPPGEPPFEAQRQTCALITQEPRAYVLNDMGTGKTRAALWAWDYLNNCKLAKKLLIVVTLSNINSVWARELFQTLPHRKYAVLHHSDRKVRIKRLADPDAEVFIINHDGLKLIKDEIGKRDDIDTLIIDELAVYRNGSATRTKHMIKYASMRKWVWGMTGSPIPRAPTDAWALAKIVTPNTVPQYFGHFRNQVMLKQGPFKFIAKPNATEEAYKALQPAVRFTLDDVVELPPVIERPIDVDMSLKQALLYNEMLKTCRISIENNEITAANAGAAMVKLLQISMGWIYNREGVTVHLDNGLRLEAIIDLINATNRKVLIFSPFKHALNGISKYLTTEGIDHATVDGDTPLNARTDIFNFFQRTEKYRVINAHPQCLAHGLTLTEADTVIWNGPVTSLEIYSQANARIRRVGQKHKQQIIHLQSSPVEKKIYALLRRNQAVQDKLLGLFEEATENAVY